MKKFDVFFLVIVALCVGLVACTYIEPEANPQYISHEVVTVPTVAETVEPKQEPTETLPPITRATEPPETTEATEAPTEATEAPTEPEPPYTEEELEALALVIYQEAGADYCSDETRLMVGTVVMNRVADPRFPDTIEEVLTQKYQYGRLHWTGLVWAERASRETEAHAVQRAYEIAERILNGERAFEAGVIWQAEFPQGTEVVAYQDGMYFCK